MKVATLFFGEVDVREEDVITFGQGLPGFETLTKFTWIQSEESAPFSYMQSTEEAGVSLLVTDPFLFVNDYDLTLPDTLQDELQIERAEDVAVLAVVTVNKDYTKFSLNLLAPMVWNVSRNLAKQIILHDSDYPTKYEIALGGMIETTQAEG
ncbi:flagellar assembly protein FliW [Paenibacillus oryzisoli]|uniref:flagellar assembly protein FliW n=1 Tax=Paenibacillus oryzisoli TaxID=1850517 RepID=UPI003D271F1A